MEYLTGAAITLYLVAGVMILHKIFLRFTDSELKLPWYAIFILSPFGVPLAIIGIVGNMIEQREALKRLAHEACAILWD